MKYNPKFNIGQSVYVIDKSYEKGVCACCRRKKADILVPHFVPKKIEIHRIYFARDSNGKVEASYTSMDWAFVLRDDDIFRTKKECEEAIKKLINEKGE